MKKNKKGKSLDRKSQKFVTQNERISAGEIFLVHCCVRLFYPDFFAHNYSIRFIVNLDWVLKVFPSQMERDQQEIHKLIIENLKIVLQETSKIALSFNIELLF